MRSQSVIILGGLMTVLSATVLVSTSRLKSEESQLGIATLNLNQTIGDSQRILELRAKQQTIAEQKRPDQDVIARVNAVLAEAGIPSDRFGGLRPESDAALPSANTNASAYRRQSVRVTLNELSVEQIGSFLSKWGQSQPLWIASRIELTHSRNASNAGQYNLNLLLSATYVAQSESS